jgi:2,4-dienoyl-CoA reductase-like NADH-dependent reductase (Old Yellow Enzyme family)
MARPQCHPIMNQKRFCEPQEEQPPPMTDTSPLFQPFTIKQLTLRNRIVMAPMTRDRSPGGVPTDAVAAYYRARAEGGTGLLVTEGVGIPHQASVDSAGIPVMYGTAALAGWKKTVDAVHAAGGAIFPQLWHMGPMRKAGIGPWPDALPMRPSGLWGPAGGHTVWGLDSRQIELAQAPVVQMTQADIHSVIAAYAAAARNAKAIGFDGIAIHGAHGYLPDAFLWRETNQRTDAYGGSIEGRTRFVVEMIRAIRQAIGDDMPIMLRFSQWKQQDYTGKLVETPQELARMLLPISEAGVDLFDASTRRFSLPEFPGSDLNLAGWAQHITGKPAMTVGSIGLEVDIYEGKSRGNQVGLSSMDGLMARYLRNEFSLVGIGRLHLSNPDFTKKIRDGTALQSYEQRYLSELL